MDIKVNFDKTFLMTIVDPDRFQSLSEVFSLSKGSVIYEATLDTVVGNIQAIIDDLSPVPLDWFSSEVLAPVQELAKLALSYNNIKDVNPRYFRFRINPSKAPEQHRKIVDKKFTGGNVWDHDTRGEEMITRRFSGTHGAMVPELAYSETIVRDIIGKIKGLTQGLFTEFGLVDSILRTPKL